MRNILLAFVALAGISALGGTPAEARDYRFCLVQGSQPGPGTCYYDTYAQCMATASGLRAYCQLNPIFAFAEQQPQRRYYKHRRDSYLDY